jgi:hypothetical protein
MRSAKISAIAITAVFFGATALAGQHGHAAPTPHGPGTLTHASTSHAPATTHASGTTHGGQSVAHRSTHTSTSSSHSMRPTQPTHAGTKTKPSKSPTPTTTTSPVKTTTVTSPIAKKIESHPQLASKVSAMLPTGMTMNQAASGFKNQGQFIAALHVSQNLGIPFADLKKEMVTNHSSLGQSIQKLRPGANAAREAEHAETEAEHEAGETTTSPATTKHAKDHR